MTKILLIDNYDSFTYNVCQALASLREGMEVEVIRNDQISVQEVKERIQQGVYDAIVISPGPGRPADAGITMDIIRELGASREVEGDAWAGTPILGVCLGHQAIGEVFGGQVVLAPEPVHGKPAQIYHQGKGIFAGLPSPFKATRYHSLIVDWGTLPEDLEVIAWTEDDLIMGLQHRKYPWIQGVQFHPESVLTDVNHQKELFKNFFFLLDESEPLTSGWEL
jgi:anthranilate synthase component II